LYKENINNFAAMEFPQFRRLSNGKSYYRIDSPTLMTEWVLVGSHCMGYRLEATILPERVLIGDLIENRDGLWEIITENEFQAVENRCMVAAGTTKSPQPDVGG
jgi:hypothetical protein